MHRVDGITLDVICDVSISRKIKSLEILKSILFETLESVIEIYNFIQIIR